MAEGEGQQQQQQSSDALSRLGKWLDRQEDSERQQSQQQQGNHPRRRSTDRPPADPIFGELRDLLKGMRDFFTVDENDGKGQQQQEQQQEQQQQPPPPAPRLRERISQGFYGKRNA